MGGIVFICFALLVFLGLPIGVAIGVPTLIPTLLDPKFAGSTSAVIRYLASALDNITTLALPLFMLSGAIMARGGLSKKLFDVFAYIVGKRTAGLPCAVIVTCIFYGAISGSGPATTAAVGAMCIPLLIRLGYNKNFSAAMVAIAGSLGVVIPPSLIFVMFGVTTGESVGDLFIAGIIPGILIGISLMVWAYIYCKKNGEDKAKIEANYRELKERGFLNVFKDGFWALLTPVIILGGIYSGIVTPTEAACLSVFYALIVSLFIYKTMSFRDIKIFLMEAINSYTPMCLLLAFAIAFSRVLTLLKAPQMLSAFLGSTFGSATTFLIAVNVAMFIIGMFMDTGSVLTILAPLLIVTVKDLGISPIHFAVMMTCNLAVGLSTPPFGLDLFVVAPLVESEASVVGKYAIPFILCFVIALLLIIFIPQLSLCLL